MPLVHALLFTGSLLIRVQAPASASPPACRTWSACRDLALEASARGDYETFHDLAWRAVQLGPKNDPALMLVLARAQSLSGRPGDAVVMLERIAALGLPVDIASDDAFRRLKGDTHLYGKLLDSLGKFEKGPGSAAVSTPIPTSGGTPGLTRSTTAAALPAAPPAPLTAIPTPPPAAPGLAPLRFSAPRFTPAGLAYDAVSRRFVVGDRDGRKLAVVDEFSRSVANLAGTRSAGFGRIAALEIDPRQGDLWVVSSEGDTTSLHKLQLSSGRVLATYPAAAAFAPVSFGDVAVGDGGVILALDSAGRRIFRLPPRGTAIEPVLALPGSVAASSDQVPSSSAAVPASSVSAPTSLPPAPTSLTPTSLAPAGAGIVYVATDEGILRVDVATKAIRPVHAASGIDLAGLTRIRAHQGALVGIQKTGPDAYRAVRVRLDRQGRRAIALDVLDPRLSVSNPTSASIIGGILYYLADDAEAGMAVRRVVVH